jgi:predicted kinase
MMDGMHVIAVSGPQASGKTTLAMALGRGFGVPVFSRDPLMRVLTGRLPRRALPAAGLELQTALLARQLELGQSCVLECVMPSSVRTLWRGMVATAGDRFVSVECVCSDPAVHRARFEQRGEGRGFDWDYVVATMRQYRPDTEADYVADALHPVDQHVAAIQAALRR